MCKDTTNSETRQVKNLFYVSDVIPQKKIQVDFNAPDISSNGGLVLAGMLKENVTAKGVNVRFIVTSNRNNKPETVYRRYCRRGTMELWIKDLKYFRADRMSCHSFRANTFRLFLYGAAYVIAHRIKTTAFADTEVEDFTIDSFIKRIMLSAVSIAEKKTFVRSSFSPNHRHRDALSIALERLSA